MNKGLERMWKSLVNSAMLFQFNRDKRSVIYIAAVLKICEIVGTLF
jgi:hypothetical protein